MRSRILTLTGLGLLAAACRPPKPDATQLCVTFEVKVEREGRLSDVGRGQSLPSGARITGRVKLSQPGFVRVRHRGPDGRDQDLLPVVAADPPEPVLVPAAGVFQLDDQPGTEMIRVMAARDRAAVAGREPVQCTATKCRDPGAAAQDQCRPGRCWDPDQIKWVGRGQQVCVPQDGTALLVFSFEHL